MPADGARVRDGARGSGRVACRVAPGNENAGKRNSKTPLSARRAGIGTSGNNAKSVQSFGKRPRAVPRIGGSFVASRGRWKRLAANQCCGGRDQSRVRGKPPAYRAV